MGDIIAKVYDASLSAWIINPSIYGVVGHFVIPRGPAGPEGGINEASLGSSLHYLNGLLDVSDYISKTYADSTFATNSSLNYAIASNASLGLLTTQNNAQDTSIGVLTSRVNTNDTSIGYIISRHNVTEVSLGVLTSDYSNTVSNVNTLTSRHNTTESSLGVLTSRHNVTESSLGTLTVNYGSTVNDLTVLTSRHNHTESSLYVVTNYFEDRVDVLDSSLTALNTSKASKLYVDGSFATRDVSIADILTRVDTIEHTTGGVTVGYVDGSLATKTDKTYTAKQDASIALKANITYVDGSLNAKQNIGDYIKSVSTGSTLKWVAGLLDVSIVDQIGATYAYVDGSLNVKTNFTYDVKQDNSIGLKADKTYVDASLVLLKAYDDVRWVDINRCGFTNENDVSLAYNPLTYVLSLYKTGANWKYMRAGIEYTFTHEPSILIGNPPAKGINYVVINNNNGTLSVSTQAWTLLDDTLPVATVSFDASLSPNYQWAEEKHQSLIDRRLHAYLHFTIGTRYINGGALNGPTVGPNNSNSLVTFGVAEAKIADEDMFETLPALLRPDGSSNAYTIFHRTNSSTWMWIDSSVPFLWGANNRILYDNGAGVMTEAPNTNNRWYNYYMLYTNLYGKARFALMPGRGLYTTLALAQAENPASFDMTGFPIAESVIAYQMNWQYVGANNNLGKVYLAATPIKINVASITSVGTAGGTDHNSLAGLQGGTTAEYYHMTAAEYTNYVGKSYVDGSLNDKQNIGDYIKSVSTGSSLRWDLGYLEVSIYDNDIEYATNSSVNYALATKVGPIYVGDNFSGVNPPTPGYFLTYRNPGSWPGGFIHYDVSADDKNYFGAYTRHSYIDNELLPYINSSLNAKTDWSYTYLQDASIELKLNKTEDVVGNIAIGTDALTEAFTNVAPDNIGIGRGALRNIDNASDNIGIGIEAGAQALDGTNNNGAQSIFIGAYTMPQTGSGGPDTNSIVIGHSAIGAGSNTVVLGNDLITDTYLKGTIHNGDASLVNVITDTSLNQSYFKWDSGLLEPSISSSSVSSLNTLTDVSIVNPIANQVLGYDSSLWKNLALINGSTYSVVDASNYFWIMSDVSLTAPSNNQALVYDASSTKFINKTINASSYTVVDGSEYFQKRITIASPSSGGAGTQGEWRLDTSYLYLCTSTNTWGRLQLTTSY